MIAEIRTYTANRGMLDGLVATFNDAVFPNHRAFGIDVIGAWVDRQQNQITWIRTFESLQDKQTRLAAYEGSDARNTTLQKVIPHLAKPPESRTLEDVYKVPP